MLSRQSILPLSAGIDSKSHLVIGGCDTVELAAEYGTPLYVLDEFTIRSKCKEFRLAFSQRYVDTTVIYASKAFLNGALANIIKEEGLGLDVVSAGEINIAKSADFPMDMVYLHGNNKSVEELKMAIKYHISRIVVDSQDELEMLASMAEEKGLIPNIMLRLTPGVDVHTHEHITTGFIGSKFGIPLFAADEIVKRAMSEPSLNLIGLHFHIGSLITETQPYEESIDVVLDFAAEMKQKHGFELEELNIGGGFGVQYTMREKVPAVSFFAEAIVTRLIGSCRRLDLSLPMLTIEPGRAIVAQAGVALYKAGRIKDIPGIRRYVSVDGGMADNIRPALYGSPYDAFVANKMLEEDVEQVTIAGRYCESGDILVKDIYLPPITRGDIIAIPVCGAYSLPLQSNYNASLKPAVVLVKEGKEHLIRRRQTYEDLTSCDLL
ncbi:MAG: diaminopimelate decarboxylase [Dehalococcoidia bacterium]|nr:MAG: diaminopimelate decarboxylase [Dehalococcoidia bacterium]